MQIRRVNTSPRNCSSGRGCSGDNSPRQAKQTVYGAAPRTLSHDTSHITGHTATPHLPAFPCLAHLPSPFSHHHSISLTRKLAASHATRHCNATRHFSQPSDTAVLTTSPSPVVTGTTQWKLHPYLFHHPITHTQYFTATYLQTLLSPLHACHKPHLTFPATSLKNHRRPYHTQVIKTTLARPLTPRLSTSHHLSTLVLKSPPHCRKHLRRFNFQAPASNLDKIFFFPNESDTSCYTSPQVLPVRGASCSPSRIACECFGVADGQGRGRGG